MQNNELSIIVLAAGRGTRMKSELPKVMHRVAGREMLNLVLDEALKLAPQEISVVVSDDFLGYEDEILRGRDVALNFVVQKERLGTCHAAMVGFEALQKNPGKVLVLYGDTPLICAETLREMVAGVDGKALCVLGFEAEDPGQYGRLVVDENDSLQKIVEFKDANDDELLIDLCNSGVMAFDGARMADLLAQIGNDNAAREFYLTDAVAVARGAGLDCGFVVADEDEVLGVNSRFELAKAEEILQNRLREHFMSEGVTLRDPFSVYFSYDTKIASDVIIGQNVVFGAEVEVESGVEIKPFSHIEGAILRGNCAVGPFARLRPGCVVGEDAKIGNFVEVKNSELGRGAKAGHLAYIGDATVGGGANIGAGVITCNYDGVNKYRTEIGEEAFIGSNSALVAPVVVGDGALVGAGSVVVKDVEAGDLAVCRALQKNIKDGVKKLRKK